MRQYYGPVNAPFSWVVSSLQALTLRGKLSEALAHTWNRQALKECANQAQGIPTDLLKYIIKIQSHSYIVNIAFVLKFELGHCTQDASIMSILKIHRLPLIWGICWWSKRESLLKCGYCLEGPASKVHHWN